MVLKRYNWFENRSRLVRISGYDLYSRKVQIYLVDLLENLSSHFDLLSKVLSFDGLNPLLHQLETENLNTLPERVTQFNSLFRILN